MQLVQRLQNGVLFVVSDPGRPPPGRPMSETRRTKHRSEAFGLGCTCIRQEIYAELAAARYIEGSFRLYPEGLCSYF